MTTKLHCTYRNKYTCKGELVGRRDKTRIRFGKPEKFTYILCEYHDKVAKR